MCLYRHSSNTTRTLKRFQYFRYLTFYKCCIVHKGGLHSPYYHFKYKPGWNIAKGQLRSEFEINAGAIHVFTNEKRAKQMRYTSFAIVPVRGYKKDFICAGSGQDACFKKIWIAKSDYQFAIKRK